MTKTEKETLYNLLETSQSYLRGFRDNTETMPDFSDDAQNLNAKNLNTQNSDIQNSQGEATNSTKMTLSLLKEKVASCTRCQLCKTRKNTVFGQGVEFPEVLVIGEGPGVNEDVQGLPFVGEAGQLLDKMLGAINLSRATNCYIANIVKCRPPNNRDPLPDESNACISYLETQIHLLKPKMILCVGRIAAHNLFNCSDSVNSMRGKIYDVHGIPAMMTYHPSALLRDESLKRPAWEDLKLFRANLNKVLAGEKF